MAHKCDLRVTYWSSHRKRFATILITPEELEGLKLKCRDHTNHRRRELSVSRIKLLRYVPTAETVLPLPPETIPVIPPSVWFALAGITVALGSIVWLSWPSPPKTEAVLPQGSLLSLSTNESLVGLILRPPALWTESTGTNTETVSLREPETLEQYLQRAQRRAGRGDLQGALLDFTKAIELDPRRAHTYYLRAVTLVGYGDWDGAMADCLRATELEPRHIETHLLKGDIHFCRGEYAAAKASYDTVLGIDAYHAAAYAHRALARYYGGDKEGALADARRAVDLNPRSATIQNTLAWLYYREGLYMEARATVELAVQLDPTDANVYDTRAWVRLARDDIPGAESDAATAVQLSPASAAGLSSAGLLHYLKGEYEKAIEAWTKAGRLQLATQADLEPWIAKARQLLAKREPRPLAAAAEPLPASSTGP